MTFGFDLALTGVLSAEQHYFVIEVGTTSGAELLQPVFVPPPKRFVPSVIGMVRRLPSQWGHTIQTQTLEPILAQHPFLKDLNPRHLGVIVGCASNVRFDAGAYSFREGQEANQFYIIRHGKVALELFSPGGGVLTIQTLGAGEVLGWSWLFPPYRWLFDARVLELTRAIALER